MAEHMDLYTDCPDCDGKRYDARPMMCARCRMTGIVPVHVKALEWDKHNDAAIDGIIVYGVYDLDNCSAFYYAKGETYLVGDFPSVDAAKAACQAHHERMVMAMLVIVP